MQPVLSPANEAQFSTCNGAMAGWALVLCIAVVSFFVHVQPDQGISAEQAAQGFLVMGAAAALVHGGFMRFSDTHALEWRSAPVPRQS